MCVSLSLSMSPRLTDRPTDRPSPCALCWLQYGDCCPGCGGGNCFCDAVCGQVGPMRRAWNGLSADRRTCVCHECICACLSAVRRLLPWMRTSGVLLRRCLCPGRLECNRDPNVIERAVPLDATGLLACLCCLSACLQYGDCCPGCGSDGQCYCDDLCVQVGGPGDDDGDG